MFEVETSSSLPFMDRERQEAKAQAPEAALVAATLATAGAQTGATVNGRLRLDGRERLSSKAFEKVEIEIDGALMKFAANL